MYTELPHGELSKNKKDCVFLWIYAKNCTPYKGYELNDIPNVTLVLAEMRFDGLMGAVGGAVENGEDLYTAVQRECREEINYTPVLERIEPLATFTNEKSGLCIHSFSYECTYEELLDIRKNAIYAEHFNAENAGINLMHICKYKKINGTEAGYCNILTQNFTSTSKLELQKLVSTKNLLVNYFDGE